MLSLNRVTLAGTIADEPEAFMLGNKQCARVRLSTTESWNDVATGEKKHRNDLHRIVIYNARLVNLVLAAAKKGMRAFVEGSLETRAYVDDAGRPSVSVEVALGSHKAQFVLVGEGGLLPRADAESRAA